MRSIIGTQNAGFTIVEAAFTGDSQGFAIGKAKDEYATWGFTQRGEKQKADFYHGHYFPIDNDAPNRSAAKAKADYYHRLAEEFKQIAQYGR